MLLKNRNILFVFKEKILEMSPNLRRKQNEIFGKRTKSLH